jgi:glucan 1,3-beta-glucosidase
MHRIGNEGEKGVVEISDLMFTTRGGTAGAVLMEWNVHEESTGSAAMFDTIFRVGGAMGTDLTAQNCHWSRAYVPNDG